MGNKLCSCVNNSSKNTETNLNKDYEVDNIISNIEKTKSHVDQFKHNNTKNVFSNISFRDSEMINNSLYNGNNSAYHSKNLNKEKLIENNTMSTFQNPINSSYYYINQGLYSDEPRIAEIYKLNQINKIIRVYRKHLKFMKRKHLAKRKPVENEEDQPDEFEFEEDDITCTCNNNINNNDNNNVLESEQFHHNKEIRNAN